MKGDTIIIDSGSTTTEIAENIIASLGALSLIHYLVTDNEIGEEYKQEFSTHGIEFIIA